MAIQVITAKIQVDTTDLEAAKVEVSELEKELGMAEGSAEKITKEFSKQAKAVDELTKEEKRLIKERNKSTDPRQIRKLNKEIERTRRDVRKLSGDFRQAGRSGKRSFSLLQNAARTLGPAIAAAFSINLIKDFVTATIDAAAKFEQTQVAFTTLLGGSSEAANKLIGDLERLSLATPLTPESLNEAARTLLSFGIAQDKILPTLQRLGDVAQGDSQKLQQLSLVFSQISSAGRLMGQDLLQLINVGFNPLQVISEQTGRSVSDLKKDMEKGLITFDKVEDAFKSATEEGGLFFGAMEAQSTTFSGRVSTLEGNVDALKRQIGEQLLPVAGELVELLLEMSKNAGKVGEEFEFATHLMDGLLFVLKAVTEEERDSAAATKALARVIENIISPVDGAISAFKDLERDLKKVAIAMEQVFEEVTALFGLEIATPFKDAAEAVKNLENRQNSLKNTFDALKQATGASEEEMSAFRAQFRGFDTEGLSTEEALKRLGVEFGKFLKQSRSAKADIKPATDGIKELKEEAIDLTRFFEISGDDYLDGYLEDIKEAKDETRDLGNILGESSNKGVDGLRELGLEFDKNAERVNNWREIESQYYQELADLAIETFTTIYSFINDQEAQRVEARIANLEAEKQAEIDAFGQSATARAAIETRFNNQIELENKRLNRIRQRDAIAQAIIDGALAATRAIAQFGFPAFVPIVALIGAAVGAQIATIKSQKFAKGVIDLDGPGTGTSDSIPALLSRGESVMTAQETRAYMPTLKAIRGGFDPDLLNSFILNGLTDRIIFGGDPDESQIVGLLKRNQKTLERIANKDFRSGDVNVFLGDGPKFKNNRRRKWN